MLSPIAVDPNSVATLAFARRLAGNDLSVMISGESGTGKEVFARFIHAASPRRDGPFIAINCAAIPEQMLEALLFGYERGAFTGATSAHAGKFEQAHGGSILLDELTEMPLSLQAKLLRVIQEREVERLGGRTTLALDVRVFATTNRNLKQEVADGNFREDLYYRLNVLPLMLIPLRERPRDILPLVDHLLDKTGRDILLTDCARRKLLDYHWPGNVRELENVVQRSVALASRRSFVLDEGDLLFEAAHEESTVDTVPDSGSELCLEEQVRLFEERVIASTLDAVAGNRALAAQRLGISPRTLRHKLARIREAEALANG
ncbi:MAG: sigma 54-interacting transcriptional regulator [Pseudomonadota bacterium]